MKEIHCKSNFNFLYKHYNFQCSCLCNNILYLLDKINCGTAVTCIKHEMSMFEEILNCIIKNDDQQKDRELNFNFF